MSGPERTSEPPRTTPTYQGPERNGSAVRITVETIQLDRPVKTISVAVSGDRGRLRVHDHRELALAGEVLALAEQLAARTAQVAAGQALAVTADQLAETRAEVATLRGHVKLLREWQAAKRAELATPAPPDGDCSAWIKSLQGTSSVEARMLAVVLSEEEVGR